MMMKDKVVAKGDGKKDDEETSSQVDLQQLKINKMLSQIQLQNSTTTNITSAIQQFHQHNQLLTQAQRHQQHFFKKPVEVKVPNNNNNNPQGLNIGLRSNPP